MHFLPPLVKEDRGGFERQTYTKKTFRIPPNLPFPKGGKIFLILVIRNLDFGFSAITLS
jgi:hypothetical protein